MKIVLKGYVEAILNNGRITTTNIVTHTLLDDKLTIEGKGGSVMINSGCSVMSHNGCIFSFYNQGNIVSGNAVVSQFKGGCNGETNIHTKSKYVTINGHKIEVPSDNNDSDSGETLDIAIDNVYEISINGSGKISVYDSVSSDFNANVKGSGDIRFNELAFSSLNLAVVGSGDIRGNNTQTSVLNANVCGSGDIRGFHVYKTGFLSLTGSGDICISKTSRAKISQNRVGSGNIKVRKN